MITVTRPYLPDKEEFLKYIDQIYNSFSLTNFGNFERQLTTNLKNHLEVENLLLVANGTLALQVLYRALNIKGEVITTPFSFVATVSSLVWENIKPKFVDINATLNIDPLLIESAISSETSAILPVHVFGRPCDVLHIQDISNQYKIPTIYDAAHAFNVITQECKNIVHYGDASILSFHATKIFHTIEGGAIICKDKAIIDECKKLINFGFVGYDRIESVGINAKMNEFSAAMGCALLKNIDTIILKRKEINDYYDQHLDPGVQIKKLDCSTYNYGYYPILFESDHILLHTRDALLAKNIMARRYFYPALNTLNYVEYTSCPIAEDIASRILCLPLYPGLDIKVINKICYIVNKSIEFYQKNRTCYGVS